MKKLAIVIATLLACSAIFLSGCSNGPSKEACEKVCGTWVLNEEGQDKAVMTMVFSEDGTVEMKNYAKYSADKMETFILSGTWNGGEEGYTYEIPKMDITGDLGGTMSTEDRIGTMSIDKDGIMTITNENGNDTTARKVSDEELEEILHPSIEELTADNADKVLSSCDVAIGEIRKWDSGDSHKSLYPDQFQVSIINNSDKTIRDLNFAVAAWNSDKRPIRVAYKHGTLDDYTLCYLDDAYIEPGQTWNRDDFGWDIDEDCTYDIAFLKAIVTDATFEDGTTWENPYFDSWCNLYVNKPLA